jgi:hypothetical protein
LLAARRRAVATSAEARPASQPSAVRPFQSRAKCGHFHLGLAGCHGRALLPWKALDSLLRSGKRSASMKTLAKMYRGQYRAVEDALETWKADHDEATSVWDLEELIRTCLRLNASARELGRAVWELGYSGKARNSEEIGREVLPVLKAGVVTWKALAEGVEERVAQGYTVESADRIPAALAEIRALAADFAARRPFQLGASSPFIGESHARSRPLRSTLRSGMSGCVSPSRPSRAFAHRPTRRTKPLRDRGRSWSVRHRPLPYALFRLG